MIWSCELRVIGDDVMVSMDLDLRDYFDQGVIDLVTLEERNDFANDREMRYFVLTANASGQKSFDVEINDNGFTIFGINQPSRSMNLMPRFVATTIDQGVIFFELHSGFLYPLIDGSINLPQDLARLLLNNGQHYLNEKTQIFDGFHRDFFQQGFLNKSGTPSLLFFNTHYTDYAYLDNLRLGQDHVNLLNSTGLDIYLSEPILEDNVESSLVYQPNILHFISGLAKNNRLANVCVHLCENGFQEHNALYHKIRCVGDDIFLRMSSFEYNNNRYPRHDLEITKKFWSGNWIYKPHRHVIACDLADRDANLSWHYKVRQGAFEEIFYISTLFYREPQEFMHFLQQQDPDLAQRLVKNAAVLDQQVPRFMDHDVILKNNVNDYTLQNNTTNGFSPSLGRFYAECFCGIITETVFDYPYSVLSEKTLCCMINSRPFVLVAPVNSLGYLRDLGFQTFSDLWDESYDQEPSHNARMLKILRLIDYIDSMSLTEMQQTLSTIRDRLEHNRRLALDLYKK